MTERHEVLNVNSIDYDTENPRIKKALEKYGDKLNAERIHFALRSASEGERGASSFVGLRDSIEDRALEVANWREKQATSRRDEAGTAALKNVSAS